MRKALSGDGISSTLATMGVWATTRGVTGDLDAHTPCKYPASPVPIPGVHIEVVYGTRGCPGVMDTCDYRSELICGSITGIRGEAPPEFLTEFPKMSGLSSLSPHESLAEFS
jgi:hypothetical protein